MPSPTTFSPSIGNTNFKSSNYLINSNFDIWQRSTSTALVSAGAYVADRWFAGSGSGGTVTCSRQAHTVGQTTVPFNPTYFLRMNQTVAATSPTLTNKIEYVSTLAGTTCRVKFWAKADSARTLGVYMTQNFGTGGSPSTAVDTATQNVSLTTSFQQFTLSFTLASISGKTLGTGANDYLGLVFAMPASVTHTVDFSQVQLNDNAFDYSYEYASGGSYLKEAQELGMCQRYYEKTYNKDVAPGTSATVGLISRVAFSTFDVGGSQFVTTKRGLATVTIYSTNGTSGKITVRAGADAAGTAAANYIGPSGFGEVQGSSGLTAGTAYWYQFVADADL